MRATLAYAAAKKADGILRSTMLAPAFYIYLIGILLFLLLFSNRIVKRMIAFFSSGIVASIVFRILYLFINVENIGLSPSLTALFLLALVIPFYLFLYFRYNGKFIGFFSSLALIVADGFWVGKFIQETSTRCPLCFSFLEGCLNQLYQPLAVYVFVYLLLILMFCPLAYAYSYFAKGNKEGQFADERCY